MGTCGSSKREVVEELFELGAGQAHRAGLCRRHRPQERVRQQLLRNPHDELIQIFFLGFRV